MNKSDRELIDASIHRDDQAFAEIFDRHAPAVYRFALSLARVPHNAEDLTQQTFITAWRRLADIRLVGSSMLPWLLVSCRNHHLNLTRSISVRGEIALDHRPLAASSDEQNADVRDELRVIADAIQRLDPIDRQLIGLCIVEGRSYASASKALRVPTTTLAKRMERARVRLSKVRMDYRNEAQS